MQFRFRSIYVKYIPIKKEIKLFKLGKLVTARRQAGRQAGRQVSGLHDVSRQRAVI
jgi:hypothetical protein